MQFRPRILLADDHDGILQRVSSILDPQFNIVGTVRDGTAAVEAVFALKPDLVVMDIFMHEMDGIEATRELKRRGSDARVVFLSVQRGKEYVSAAFASGAAGYVLKARMHSDLVQAIDQALAGAMFVSPGTI